MAIHTKTKLEIISYFKKTIERLTSLVLETKDRVVSLEVQFNKYTKDYKSIRDSYPLFKDKIDSSVANLSKQVFDFVQTAEFSRAQRTEILWLRNQVNLYKKLLNDHSGEISAIERELFSGKWCGTQYTMIEI